MSDKVVTIQVAGHEPVTLSANAVYRMTRLCAIAWQDDYLWEQIEGQVDEQDDDLREECQNVLDGILEFYWAIHPEHKDEIAAQDALGQEHFVTY